MTREEIAAAMGLPPEAARHLEIIITLGTAPTDELRAAKAKILQQIADLRKEMDVIDRVLKGR